MVRSKPKLLIVGHGRHGKDTVCEILRDTYGFTFVSSSHFCCERVIWPAYKQWQEDRLSQPSIIKHMGSDPSWLSPEECFNARSGYRAMWFDLIADFNKYDNAALSKAIFAEHDIYAGLRSAKEFYAASEQAVFDYAIWVDRSAHLPPEPADSMQIRQEMADFSIDNNGDLQQLKAEVDRMVRVLV